MIVSLINNISEEKSSILKILSKEILKNNSPLIVYRYSYGEDLTELFDHRVDTEEVISLTSSSDDIIHIFYNKENANQDLYNSILNASISENIEVSLEDISSDNPIYDNYTGNREKFNICMEVALPQEYNIKFISILADAINSYAILHFDTYSKVGDKEYDFGFMKSPKGWWYRKTEFDPRYPIQSYYAYNKIVHTMIKGNHKYYLMDIDGHCVDAGWHTIDGTDLIFYTNSESELYTGWHFIDDNWYYFSEKTDSIGKALNDIVYIGENKYDIIKGKLIADDQNKFELKNGILELKQQEEN